MNSVFYDQQPPLPSFTSVPDLFDILPVLVSPHDVVTSHDFKLIDLAIHACPFHESRVVSTKRDPGHLESVGGRWHLIPATLHAYHAVSAVYQRCISGVCVCIPW